MIDESVIVAQRMISYGGSFVKRLGDALQHADHINQAKIKNTWPEYWDQYKNMGV